MKSCYVALVAMVIGAVSLSLGQEPDTFDLARYPLKVGTTWVYRAGPQAAPQHVKIEVEKHETLEIKKGKEIQKVLCARLLVTKEKRSLTEHVAVQGDGIYRFTSANKDMVPAFCFFKVAKDKSWQVESTIDGKTIKGSFTRGAEEITLAQLDFNGKKQKNLRLKTVTSSGLEFQDGQKRKLQVTYWFAEGLGMVKQRIKVDDFEEPVILELVEFKGP